MKMYEVWQNSIEYHWNPIEQIWLKSTSNNIYSVHDYIFGIYY